MKDKKDEIAMDSELSEQGDIFIGSVEEMNATLSFKI